mmetsp:Transcript_124700/g.248969  ORF Transcript_124700/g.248969 Transcript_124700/m.248969 type:complete len:214 (-) Transcript_124700:1134-1775(-)
MSKVLSTWRRRCPSLAGDSQEALLGRPAAARSRILFNLYPLATWPHSEEDSGQADGAANAQHHQSPWMIASVLRWPLIQGWHLLSFLCIQCVCITVRVLFHASPYITIVPNKLSIDKFCMVRAALPLCRETSIAQRLDFCDRTDIPMDLAVFDDLSEPARLRVSHPAPFNRLWAIDHFCCARPCLVSVRWNNRIVVWPANAVCRNWLARLRAI